VLTNAELRSNLRARGLARAHQFSWETSVRRIHDIYLQVLHAPQRAAAPAAHEAGGAPHS
jgi:hypothetical protein